MFWIGIWFGWCYARIDTNLCDDIKAETSVLVENTLKVLLNVLITFRISKSQCC
jgi:hypothetical protein